MLLGPTSSGGEAGETAKAEESHAVQALAGQRCATHLHSACHRGKGATADYFRLGRAKVKGRGARGERLDSDLLALSFHRVWQRAGMGDLADLLPAGVISHGLYGTSNFVQNQPSGLCSDDMLRSSEAKRMLGASYVREPPCGSTMSRPWSVRATWLAKANASVAPR